MNNESIRADSTAKKPIGRGVIGILRQGGQLLVIRRAEHIVLGGTWCFPGGHVEPGETPRRAVQRELREELNIQVEPVQRLGAIKLPETGYVLVAWMVKQVHGSILPNPLEIAEYRWLLPAEIRKLDGGLPSNEIVLTLLKNAVNQAI